MAAKFCALLMGQFKRNDADDPEIFTRALIAVMQQYPVVVLEEVCSPINGLATKGTFLPSLFEIREACNETMRVMIARWHLSRLPPERLARINGRPDDRRALPSPDDTPERRSAFIDSLKAKHGEKFGLGGDEPEKPKGEAYKPKTLGELTEHYRTHGLAFVKKPHSQIKPEKNDDQDRFQHNAIPQGAGGEEPDNGGTSA